MAFGDLIIDFGNHNLELQKSKFYQNTPTKKKGQETKNIKSLKVTMLSLLGVLSVRRALEALKLPQDHWNHLRALECPTQAFDE